VAGILSILAISAIISGGMIYNQSRSAFLTATRKTSMEMVFIEDAAKRYYKMNGAWPPNYATLKTLSYLPAAYPASNPWGNAYVGAINGANFQVSTTLPSTGYTSSITSFVPGSTVVGNTVTSTIPIPGMEPLYQSYLNKSGTPASRTMQGDLSMSGNKVTNLANAILPTDGINLGQATSRYVLSTGDTMTGNLTVPELMASNFVDSGNPSYFYKPSGTGGETNLNDVSVQDVYLRSMGWWATQGAQLGSPGTWQCYARPLQINGCCNAGYATTILTGDMSTNPAITDQRCTTGTTSAICCK
jgi:hypothetical protein